MAFAKSGSKSKVALSRDGMAWADVSQATYGLDGLEISDEEGTTEVAGGGVTAGMALTGFVEHDGSFTVDETEITRPILLGYSGKRLYVRYRRDGDGTGLHQSIFSGPCTVTHTLGERDKGRFAVEVMTDGAPDNAVQA